MFGGFSVANEVADELGVERKLLKTALTDMRVNFAHLKAMKKMLLQANVDEIKAIKVIAIMSYDSVVDGLANLLIRFPDQPEIIRAQNALVRCYDSNDLSDARKIIAEVFGE